MLAEPTPNQSIFLRWPKPLDALIAGRYMKLGTTKASPTITVWRTVKSAGNRWTQGTAQAFVTTNPSRCQMARMFERDRALLARAIVLLHKSALGGGLGTTPRSSWALATWACYMPRRSAAISPSR